MTLRFLLTKFAFYAIIFMVARPMGTITVAVAFSVPRKRIFCLPRTEGGDSMDFITWHDLIQLALLVFAILSVFYNKKR